MFIHHNAPLHLRKKTKSSQDLQKCEAMMPNGQKQNDVWGQGKKKKKRKKITDDARMFCSKSDLPRHSGMGRGKCE